MDKNNLKKNYIYNVLYQILIIIVPLFTSPYLTRVLGPEKLGIYSFTQSYAHYFVLFILLGMAEEHFRILEREGNRFYLVFLRQGRTHGAGILGDAALIWIDRPEHHDLHACCSPPDFILTGFGTAVSAAGFPCFVESASISSSRFFISSAA